MSAMPILWTDIKDCCSVIYFFGKPILLMFWCVSYSDYPLPKFINSKFRTRVSLNLLCTSTLLYSLLSVDLDSYADPSIEDGHGRNCLHYAFMHAAKGDIIELLLAHMKSLPKLWVIRSCRDGLGRAKCHNCKSGYKNFTTGHICQPLTHSAWNIEVNKMVLCCQNLRGYLACLVAHLAKLEDCYSTGIVSLSSGSTLRWEWYP